MIQQPVFSNHALLQMKDRGIDIDTVKQTIADPLTHYYEAEGQRVYQRVFKIGNKDYLVRVFVNESVEPPLIKTVYRTSKINKYYEGEI